MTRQVGRTAAGIRRNYVAIYGNAGIAGATMTYGVGLSVTADASGNYIIIVPAGWSGTVTPSKTYYEFTPDGKSYIGIAGSDGGEDYEAELVYIFRDDFLDDRAAGQIDGTDCTGGQVERDVIDTENKLTISSNKLVCAGGKSSPGWGDPGLSYDAQYQRASGKTLFVGVTFNDTSDALLGFHSTKVSTLNDGLKFAGGVISPRELGLTKAGAETYNVGDTIDFAIVCKASGYQIYCRKVAAWSLIYDSAISTLTNFYARLSNYTAVLDVQYMRFAQLNMPINSEDLTLYASNP